MKSPLKVAHRGDSSSFRENTIAAIQSAIDCGADIVEIDIRQASDGTVVVLHDPTLERLWGYPVKASELPITDIESLGFGALRIPTLKKTLELFQNSTCVVMIDMDTADHALAAVDVARSVGLPSERVIWCGDLEAMRLIRSRSTTARIWLPWNSTDPLDLSLVAEIKPEYVNAHYSYWNRAKVESIHALGLKVSAWTVDDAPTMRWAKAIGIDSVTSNQLTLLKDVFAESSAADSMNLERASEVAQSLAAWALMICQIMAPGKIATKANAADLVTEVDTFIEQHVREVILANFPSHNIVGEEFGGEFDALTPTWYIDPVDGTTNFANRTPWSSFSLALALGREPLVAATTDPWRNKIFTAIKGGGAYINGDRISIADQVSTENALAGRVVLTELAGSQPWPGLIEFLRALDENFCTMRIMGAGTLTLTSVSANYAIGAVVHRFSPIDHLAAALIAKESGCIALNEHGEIDLFPESGGQLIVQPSA
jgi:myo-inositol-1(or 4)-monophosphatase/deoxyribonuclease-2